MPALSNPKHEMFANNIANNMTQTDAYETAGYQRSPSAASQLGSQQHIQARVQELISIKAGHISGLQDDIDNLPSELNRDWLIKTLMKNVKIAQNERQIAPANKAVEMLAELIGLSIKKPGASAAKDGEETGEPTKQTIDLDKMADGMGKLGAILDRRDNKPTNEATDEGDDE